MILKQTLLSAGAFLVDDCSIAPKLGIYTPYPLILFIRSLQSTSLLPRGETLFHFNLIINSNPNPHHRIFKRQNPQNQNYSKTISKLVVAEFPHHFNGNIPKQFKNLS